MDVLDDLAALFKVLIHPTRLAILAEIVAARHGGSGQMRSHFA